MSDEPKKSGVVSDKAIGADQPVSNLALATTLAEVLNAWRTEGSWGDGIYEGHAAIYERAEEYIVKYWPSLAEAVRIIGEGKA